MGEESQFPAKILNVAAVCRSTQALGPGNRAVIWTQGCLLHCRGCVAPDWIPIHPAHLLDPVALADELMSDPAITGLTFSGGEPMLQASALAALARRARQHREINILCFTGFQLSQLRNNPPDVGVHELLREVDTLIDGPYLEGKNDNLGLRGSSNQRIHHFTQRLSHVDFEHSPRRAEISVQDGSIFLVGVPSRSLKTAFEGAVEQAHQSLRTKRVFHERV